MRSVRFSIKGMMTVIGVVALNLAVIGALLNGGPPALIGVGLPWIVLQVAVFRLIRTRGRARTFWAGFLAFGVVGTALFFWAATHPRNVGIGLDASGTFHRTEIPGSRLWDELEMYTSFFSAELELLPFFPGFDGKYGEVVSLFTIALLWCSPQLLFALAGGFLARWLAMLMARPAQPTTFGAEVVDTPRSALVVSKRGKPTPRFR